jgi:uncharacterized surface protein with fasciclin (FAS1) repeats
MNDPHADLPADYLPVLSSGPTKNLLATLAGSGEFATLVIAVDAAGLTRSLSGAGPFTMFAPTDAALARLPPGVWDALLRNGAKLKAILNYHVIAGYVSSKHLKSGDTATLQGSPLTAATDGEFPTVGGARIVGVDLAATNGVIHAIDALLLPKHWRLPSAA